MSTDKEKLDAIRFAVEMARRQLLQLNSKSTLTRAEQFEKDMTIECIKRGELLLGKPAEYRP